MTLRMQLVLAFLLLAVVPLAGVTVYSYVTSQRVLRRAIEAESGALAEGIGRILRREVSWESLRESAHHRQTDCYSDIKMARDVARMYDNILDRQHSKTNWSQ